MNENTNTEPADDTQRAVIELDVNDPMYMKHIENFDTEEDAAKKASRLTDLANRLESDRYYIVSEPVPSE